MTVAEVPVTQPRDVEELLKRRGGAADRAFSVVTLLAGLSVLVVLVLIAYATTHEAWPILHHKFFEFLFTRRWAPNDDRFGSLAFLYGTVVTSVIALVFAVPLSIGIALFITEVAPRRVRQWVVYVLDLLAVVPSVVFGLWGVLVLAKPIGTFYDHVGDVLGPVPVVGRLFDGPANGRSLFTAGIVLALMIVPIITSLTRAVLETTPAGEKEAAIALGATRWEMIRGAVIPHSKGGIVGAVTLGLGRAMGETIAAALVIGSNPQITAKLFQGGYSMPSVIANEFGESSGLWRAALIGLGVVLFALTIVVNLTARAVVGRSIKRSRGE
jgi:phosphate transport system permease protein